MEPSPEYRSDRPRVGLLYDERMCRHSTPNGESHPESPDRLKTIWKTLESAGISQKCVVLRAEEAEAKHVALVHTRKHVGLIRKIGCSGYDAQRRERVASRFNSIYLNEGSSQSAFLAAGSVIQVAEKVAKGELDSAIALVRPPGHHAEPDEAMGFCLFNNVAIAASYLLNEKTELGIKKILIVDWDVHHGNGTQKMFWTDPRVLFFSVHRHDFGSFYPAGDDGSHTMIGGGAGTGFNINVPWQHGQCGDADYLAVWDHILIPVAESYEPDIILISGGFDAAIGDPLGGCCITPYGYSTMLEKLMRFANGKIVMVLEGGYNLKSLANSVLACSKALLSETCLFCELKDQPFDTTFNIIQEVRCELSRYWPILAAKLPRNAFIATRKTSPVELPPLHQIQISSSSGSDNEFKEEITISPVSGVLVEETSVQTVDDVIIPLSNLSVKETCPVKEALSNISSGTECSSFASDHILLSDHCMGSSVLWRSLLSKIYIWYASYGSNIWTSRFLCYIRGGQVEGMKRPCPGSKDKTMPNDVTWKTVPHRLFFARSHTTTWGAGGVAFLHPQPNNDDKAYMCLYKITLEQFNDVLHQENDYTSDLISPYIDQSSMNYIMENRIMSLDVMGGWYCNVLYLGKENDIPVLTMTCSLADIEGFISAKLPMLPPSEVYKNVLVKGLVEGKQLPEREATDYITNASLLHK